MYDAIVIGARCGGAATAMLLARKGHRVLLVDRATFPSDIPHGHFIHRSGPTRLAKWGLLDRVLATGCPAITSFTSDFGDFPLVGNDLSVDGVPFACGPRRTALDRVLVDAAVNAGVELREGFSVESLTMDGDRVTGIRGGDRRAGTSGYGTRAHHHRRRRPQLSRRARGECARVRGSSVAHVLVLQLLGRCAG
jgi:flavin-dependent dehydrogenase